MKIQFAAALTTLLGVQGFSTPQNLGTSSSSQSATKLQAHKNKWMGPAAATAMGWALASQIAVASTLQEDQQPSWTSASSLLAVEKLDFALPSYDAIGKSTGGFGEGTEARLGISDSMFDPGANEKAKQAEAMKRAEEARLAKKQEEKKRREMQYEADLKKAELKRQENERRLKEIFN